MIRNIGEKSTVRRSDIGITERLDCSRTDRGSRSKNALTVFLHVRPKFACVDCMSQEPESLELRIKQAATALRASEGTMGTLSTEEN